MSSIINNSSDSEVFEGSIEISPKKKASPLTPQQKNYILEIIEIKRHILEDKSTDFGSISKKKQVWNDLAKDFSSKNGNPKKTGSQLREWWSNLKKSSKKKVNIN